MKQEDLTYSPDRMEIAARHYFGVGVKPALDLDELTQILGLREPRLGLDMLHRAIEALTQEAAEKSHTTPDFMWPGRDDSWLQSHLSHLSAHHERERKVLLLRNGLSDGRPRTLEEIGGALGLTRERIRQIERRAIGRLPLEVKLYLKQAELKPPGRSNMAEAARRLYRALSSRAGEDIHSADELADLLARDPVVWPFGLNVPSDIRHCNPTLVTRSIIKEEGGIFIDDAKNLFVKTTSKNPYANIAGKLLNVFEEVTVDSIHDGITQTWRTRTDRLPFTLSADELEAVLSGLGFEVKDHWVRPGRVEVENSLMQPTPVEERVLQAFPEPDNFSTLAQLCESVAALKRNGSTEKQFLMGKSPLFERLGPSLYGIRGAKYEPHSLSLAQAEARSKPHGWTNRAGWDESPEDETFLYRLSNRRDPPHDVGLTEEIAFWMVEAFNGFSAELKAQTDSYNDHVLQLRRSGSSIRLYGLSSVWSDLNPARGALIAITRSEPSTLRFSVHPEHSGSDDIDRIRINLGTGWISTYRGHR
jgi:hypothetical protein